MSNYKRKGKCHQKPKPTPKPPKPGQSNNISENPPETTITNASLGTKIKRIIRNKA